VPAEERAKSPANDPAQPAAGAETKNKDIEDLPFVTQPY